MFKIFFDFFGKPEKTIEVPNSVIEKYRGRVADPIIEFWEKYGFCSFSDNLFGFVNPDDYNNYMSKWLDIDDYQPIVLIKDSFGGLVFWDEIFKGMYHLDIVQGRLILLIKDFPLYLNRGIADTEYLEDYCYKKWHDEASKKVDPIKPDECYAFKLALALGGDPDVSNIKKVKWVVNFDILSQMTTLVSA